MDGALVHTENGSRGALPTHPGKLMMNLWPGIGVDGWLGPFAYAGPLQYQGGPGPVHAAAVGVLATMLRGFQGEP